MNIEFFLELVSLLRSQLLDEGLKGEDLNFLDIGAGRGQLVLAAAKGFKWRKCSGLEIMPELIEIGRGALMLLEKERDDMSEAELLLGDMYRDTAAIKAANLVFIYATCFSTSDGITLDKISKVLAENLPPRARVITVNKKLDAALGFQLLDEVKGPNPDSVNDLASAYVWLFEK